MIVMNDISEKMKLRESKISDKYKTMMLCTISHEIRSPVNQISGTLTLLKPHIRNPKHLHLIDIAQSASDTLKYKVDDLLDFYEIETGGFKLNKKLFSIEKQICIVEAIFKPLVNNKKIKLCHFVNENVPSQIYDDSKRIKQILVNLLGNAVKYTQKGIITIIVEWVDSDNANEKSGFVRFAVSDSGSGITRKRRKTLFKFLQPDVHKVGDTVSNQLAGTGLGIGQKIAKELGSEIKFISTVDSGSRFWFEVKSYKLAEFGEVLKDASKVTSTIKVPKHSQFRIGHVSKTSKLNLLNNDQQFLKVIHEHQRKHSKYDRNKNIPRSQSPDVFIKVPIIH